MPDQEPVQCRLADHDVLSGKSIAECEQCAVVILGEPGHDLNRMRFGLPGVPIPAKRAGSGVTEVQIAPAADARSTHAETLTDSAQPRIPLINIKKPGCPRMTNLRKFNPNQLNHETPETGRYFEATIWQP